MNSKRVFALLTAGILCVSVMFTGCAKKKEVSRSEQLAAMDAESLVQELYSASYPENQEAYSAEISLSASVKSSYISYDVSTSGTALRNGADAQLSLTQNSGLESSENVSIVYRGGTLFTANGGEKQKCRMTSEEFLQFENSATMTELAFFRTNGFQSRSALRDPDEGTYTLTLSDPTEDAYGGLSSLLSSLEEQGIEGQFKQLTMTLVFSSEGVLVSESLEGTAEISTGSEVVTEPMTEVIRATVNVLSFDAAAIQINVPEDADDYLEVPHLLYTSQLSAGMSTLSSALALKCRIDDSVVMSGGAEVSTGCVSDLDLSYDENNVLTMALSQIQTQNQENPTETKLNYNGKTLSQTANGEEDSADVAQGDVEGLVAPLVNQILCPVNEIAEITKEGLDLKVTFTTEGAKEYFENVFSENGCSAIATTQYTYSGVVTMGEDGLPSALHYSFSATDVSISGIIVNCTQEVVVSQLSFRSMPSADA